MERASLEPVRDEKQCPDCAELVRCRRGAVATTADRFEGFRIPQRWRGFARRPELIRAWRVELPAGEDVIFFGYRRLDSATATCS